MPLPTHPPRRAPGNSSAKPDPTFVGLCALLVLLGWAAPAEAQLGNSGNTGGAPTVFLDCQGWVMGCDRSHLRTEITFVNWARDRADSDVHLIITSQATGAGGNRYTLDFIGLGEMERLSDELTYTSSGTDVMAEVRDGLTQAIRLGLMRFAVERGLGTDFALEFHGDPDSRGNGGEEGDGGGSGAAYDPWNYWIFEVGISGDMDLRETQTDSRFRPTFEADRVTEAWKLNFSTRLDFRRDRRQLADGTEVRDDRDDWRVSALVVRSVTDHVSIGVDAGARSSVDENRHARVRMAPAVEYNYYPYQEANRRQLIAHYAPGMEHSNYMEETAFGVLQETLPVHRLGLQYRAREEWGDAGVGMDFSQYLHDAELYSMGLGGHLNYRIVRGLSLNIQGSAAWVNDEIHTPATAISDEDILLGRQSLPSGYRYEASLGVSYQWGSSFSNVVNQRFPRSVR